ncbi:MAG: DNA polymerase III subunit alpha [Rhizobiaceae bacterium]
MQFIHLNVHSSFSLLESALPLAKLVDLAIADNQPALAVTDRNNLFGALEFSEKASAKGLQPIMGCKIAIEFWDDVYGEGDADFESSKKDHLREFPGLVLLAMNNTGFRNLAHIVSNAHLSSEAGSLPHITYQELEEFNSGLICLTAGNDGPINQYIKAGRTENARDCLNKLQEFFGDRLYVELQRHEDKEQQVEPGLLKLAYDMELPIVATNQPLFPTRDDFAAHDALICIAEGAVVAMENRKRFTEEHYFKSQAEMVELFSDLPEALENTIEIAKRCHYREKTHSPILPRFIDGTDNPEDAMKQEIEALNAMARSGLDDRLDNPGIADGFKREEYNARLEFELGIIEQMGFPGYFLIVADFINWAKERGIPVGPGRGSGAGSLVAYSLRITDLDPMRFTLLFERFLNPERLSMPDFDIDFCQDRREEVIRYVQDKYGRDQVAQIITFGSLQARAVLRDVGRVLQMPYGQVDRICKLVPANPANPVTLKQAIDEEPKLAEAREEEEIVGELFDIALRLEGLYRHASTHAAGIVIGDRKLDQLVPLYRDPRSDMPVTQYNMKWVEPAGLVKFDFLGLKTLTVLDKAVKFIKEKGIEIDLSTVEIDDAKTYEMLMRGDTVGVFQLESQGMRKALLGMKPDRFEDIIALVALYRPGPMDNIPTYNARKHGEEAPDYYHDKIESILKETYGVIIYQEQVLQIARTLAGYTLGEADFLRKAMGKKIKAEMDAQRIRFVDGAVENGLKKAHANTIFDVLAKFAGYGFNKAHAASYALVSYHTAYLKAWHPVEFLAASMQLDMGNTDKLNIFHQEAEGLDIDVVPPSIQTSKVGFSVKDGKIFYALAAIKGVGEGAVEQIVEDRLKNGPFKSITDFFSRLEVKNANKRTLENLICAGALDCFGFPREQLLAGLERLIGHAARISMEREVGQNDMFGASMGVEQKVELPLVEAWTSTEKLQREFASIGYYLSAHPLDEYREILDSMRVQLYADFEKAVRSGASAGRLAGTITAKQLRKTRSGKRMGILMISDPSGQYEAVIFEESLNRFADLLEPGTSVIMLVGADIRPEGVSVRVNSVESLEKAANKDKRNIRIFMRDQQPFDNLMPLMKSRGDGKVSIVVIQDNGEREVEILLREKYQLGSQLARAIKAVPGIIDVQQY